MHDINFGVIDFKFPVSSPLLGKCDPKDKGKSATLFYYSGLYCVAPSYSLSANNATDLWLRAAFRRVAMDAGILCRSPIFAFESYDSAALNNSLVRLVASVVHFKMTRSY